MHRRGNVRKADLRLCGIRDVPAFFLVSEDGALETHSVRVGSVSTTVGGLLWCRLSCGERVKDLSFSPSFQLLSSGADCGELAAAVGFGRWGVGGGLLTFTTLTLMATKTGTGMGLPRVLNSGVVVRRSSRTGL